MERELIKTQSPTNLILFFCGGGGCLKVKKEMPVSLKYKLYIPSPCTYKKKNMVNCFACCKCLCMPTDRILDNKAEGEWMFSVNTLMHHARSGFNPL